MAKDAPGKHFRKGISLVEIMRMFPNDATAEAWFAEMRWPHRPACPHCGSINVLDGAKHATMPYRCREKGCRKRFSLKTGTVMEASNIGYQKWAIAIYLSLTSLKSVSSMKLHRDLGVTQKSAWHMAHRLRRSFAENGGPFTGPVEVDESYFGGKRKNMSNAKRAELADTGRGAVGKTAVVGMRDRATNQVRAKVVESTDKPTLQGFVVENTDLAATVYSDDASALFGASPGARDGQAQRFGVRPWDGAHKRHRELLGDAGAGAQGHLPQVQPQAPGPLRSGVRRQAQHPRFRYPGPDAPPRRANGWQAAQVRIPDRAERP